MPSCFKNQCDHEVRIIPAFLPHATSLFLVICFELFLEGWSYLWSTVSITRFVSRLFWTQLP